MAETFCWAKTSYLFKKSGCITNILQAKETKERRSGIMSSVYLPIRMPCRKSITSRCRWALGCVSYIHAFTWVWNIQPFLAGKYSATDYAFSLYWKNLCFTCKLYTIKRNKVILLVLFFLVIILESAKSVSFIPI